MKNTPFVIIVLVATWFLSGCGKDKDKPVQVSSSGVIICKESFQCAKICKDQYEKDRKNWQNISWQVYVPKYEKCLEATFKSE